MHLTIKLHVHVTQLQHQEIQFPQKVQVLQDVSSWHLILQLIVHMPLPLPNNMPDPTSDPIPNPMYIWSHT